MELKIGEPVAHTKPQTPSKNQLDWSSVGYEITPGLVVPESGLQS